MRYLPALLLLTLLSGCGHTQPPEAPELGFTTDREHYAPRAEVHLQLENRTNQIIGYNLCFSELERETNQGWQKVEDPDTVCTTIQHGLEPGGNTSYKKTLINDLPEGTYRFSTEVEHRDTGRREQLVTDAFSVET